MKQTHSDALLIRPDVVSVRLAADTGRVACRRLSVDAISH